MWWTRIQSLNERFKRCMSSTIPSYPVVLQQVNVTQKKLVLTSFSLKMAETYLVSDQASMMELFWKKCRKKVPSHTFERVLNAFLKSIHTPTAIYISAFIPDTCTCTRSPTTSSEIRSWDLVLWKRINDSNN